MVSEICDASARHRMIGISLRPRLPITELPKASLTLPYGLCIPTLQRFQRAGPIRLNDEIAPLTAGARLEGLDVVHRSHDDDHIRRSRAIPHEVLRSAGATSNVE